MVRPSTVVAALVVAWSPDPVWAVWTFSEVGAASGFTHGHGYVGVPNQSQIVSGGVAAADYDGDGDVDVYAVRGSSGPNLLYRNEGNGIFTEVGAAAGVAGPPTGGAGPVFADIDGDGHLDLLVGGVDGSASAVYRNDGTGGFVDVTLASGFAPASDTFAISLADVDRDDDLDVAAVHWGFDQRVTLWENDGTGSFTDVTAGSGLVVGSIYGFSPTFSDIDGDGWVDLLVAADFGTSRVFRNQQDGTFTEITTSVIDDENGMGAAAFDYDHDGDVDWFVTSVWDPNQIAEGNWGVTGNRLYENQGSGIFTDVTTSAGVREGDWGWGACAQDLDQDGHPDLFHTNGWVSAVTTEFDADPSRFFRARGDGTFEEVSASLGIVDTGQGRGVACFDADGDGDIDVFVANNGATPTLHRNEGPPGDWLRVRLTNGSKNRYGVGAVVRVTIGATTQMREIRAGTNFASAEPIVAHFGVGAATTIDEVRVEWPDGTVTTQSSVAAGQEIVIVGPVPTPTPTPAPTPTPHATPTAAPPAVPAVGSWTTALLGAVLVLLARRRIRSRLDVGRG